MTTDDPSLRAVLRGRRGALLVAMLVAEFAVSVDLLGYAAVLPVAAAELDGSSLYSAALTASQVLQITCMAFGAMLYGRLGPTGQLWTATAVWTAGATMTALAPSMPWIVAGMATRGVAGGLIAGLGIGVLSGLYEGERERERALGLFGLMWVLPSLVAPTLNAVLLAVAGWRVTLAWPIVLLVAARLLVGRNLRLVQRPPAASSRPRGAAWFLVLAVALAGAQALIGASGWLWVAVAVAVTTLAAVPMARALRALVPAARRTRDHAWAMALCAVGYFGINALVPLLASRLVDASGATGAVLVALGPLAWTTLQSSGLVTRGRTIRLAWCTAAATGAATVLLALAIVLPAADWLRVALLGVAIVLAGLGMGAIYARLLSGAFVGFDDSGGTTRAHGAVGLNLAETAGSVAGMSVLAGVVGSALAARVDVAAATVVAMGLALVVLWLRVAPRLEATPSGA